MARRALNRMIAITNVYELLCRFATMTFFLPLREESMLLFTVATGLYLQNVLPPFYPRAPHKVRRSHANRPAASNDALRVLSMVVALTTLFAMYFFSLSSEHIGIFLKINNHYINKIKHFRKLRKNWFEIEITDAVSCFDLELVVKCDVKMSVTW